MGFLDEVVITARSGDGGRGCVSFRREKFVPKGGPDGGDGGDGGDIIVKVVNGLYSLAEYGSRICFRAGGGAPGRGKKQSGKRGENHILEVPTGTLIQEPHTNEILADLVHDKQEVLLIRGGRGGKGNQHFATSTNKVPKTAQPGLPGQEKEIRLSLKFLSDIGLVGLPNSGKSTLLSQLTMARPKVASYPFTTIFPNLGIMTLEDESPLVIADIPGLIQGASQGRGLGHRFLKHIERTKLLLHLLDITYQPRKEIIEDYHMLRSEMAAYNPALAHKPHMVLINKMDLYGPGHRNLNELLKALEEVHMKAMPISGLTGKGLGKLKSAIWKKWV